MGKERQKIISSSGDKIEVELIVPSNYKYDDEDRNDFIQGFTTGTLSDREIERAIRKRWVKEVDYDE